MPDKLREHTSAKDLECIEIYTKTNQNSGIIEKVCSQANQSWTPEAEMAINKGTDMGKIQELVVLLERENEQLKSSERLKYNHGIYSQITQIFQ